MKTTSQYAAMDITSRLQAQHAANKAGYGHKRVLDRDDDLYAVTLHGTTIAHVHGRLPAIYRMLELAA